MILSDVRKRFWGVGRGLFVVGVILLVGGCGRGSKPEEIWGETGVGSGQLVYPRDCLFEEAGLFLRGGSDCACAAVGYAWEVFE